jgi:hypothetical protein
MVVQIFGSMGLALVCTVYYSIIGMQSQGLDAAKIKISYSQPSQGQQSDSVNIWAQLGNYMKEIDRDERVYEKARNSNLFGIGLDMQGADWIYREYKTNHYIWFHMFMIFYSFYISTVFTNWGFSKIGDSVWRYSGEENYRAMIMKYINVCLMSL